MLLNRHNGIVIEFNPDRDTVVVNLRSLAAEVNSRKGEVCCNRQLYTTVFINVVHV